jgi:hypothetical protein
LREVRKNIFSKTRKDSPSAQAETRAFAAIQQGDTFYACNRPQAREPQLPLTLLHPVFGTFVDNCKQLTLTASDYDCAKSLKNVMCAFYGDEGARRKKFLEELKNHDIVAQAAHIGSTKCVTDGHVLVGDHPILIVEVKNEIGWKGAEPSLQGFAYYDSFVRENRLWEDFSTIHPCFLLFVAGMSRTFLLA